MVDRLPPPPPSNFIAGRPKAALLFGLLLVVLFFLHLFSLARFIAVVSICLVICDSSIVATCPSVPAAHFAFCLCFNRFVFVVSRCLSGEPKQNQGRGLVDRKLVQAPPPPPPSNFIAGRPKASLLFWFFGDFRCGVPLFIVILVIYQYKNS